MERRDQVLLLADRLYVGITFAIWMGARKAKTKINLDHMLFFFFLEFSGGNSLTCLSLSR